VIDGQSVSLERMVAAQRAFQERIGFDFASMTVGDRVAYVKEMYVAAVMELGEALNETTWKPWATRNSGEYAIHSLELITELTDVWCFICNIWFAVMPDATPAEIAVAMGVSHDAKVALNHTRQDDGYTGSNKCPGCGRALDDAAVTTHCVPDLGYCATRDTRLA
jgi:hypothetical protein